MIRIIKGLLLCMFILCFFESAFAQNKNSATKKTLTEILHLVGQRQKKFINFNPKVTNQIFLEDIFKGKDAIGLLNKSLDYYDLEIKGGSSNYLYVRPIRKINLKGSVIDEKSKSSISNVKIMLVGYNSVRSTRSGINGDFNFILRKGNYVIKINDISYYTKSVDVLANESTNVTIMLKKRVEKTSMPIKNRAKMHSVAKNKVMDSVAVYKPSIIQSDTIHYMSKKEISDTIMVLPKYFSSNALKTNLLLWGLATPNFAVEKRVSKHVSIELSLGLKLAKSGYESQSLSYFIQPEARYWFSSCFNGPYIGYYYYYTNYGSGDIIFPFKTQGPLNNGFYEGDLYGMGASVGYQKKISNHFAVEGVMGIGYIHLDYDKINWHNLCKNRKNLEHNYWGITKAAINIVYLF